MTVPPLEPRPSEPAPIEPIRLEGVSQRFDEALVLSDVSLCVERGEIAVVIGGSGAGKTTLLRIIIGLLRPTAGKVLIDGMDIAPLGERELHRVRAKFGMVFQYAALLDSLTVRDNVALPLTEHTRLKSKEIDDKVRRMLERLELSGTEARFPAELSGGMRKRVGLARALIREPSILVYDEPTSGLDPLMARRVDDLIVKTRDQFDVTSVVVSHDMAQALNVADHLFLLDQGRLVSDGPPKDLVSEPGTLAARFLAASRVTAEARRGAEP